MSVTVKTFARLADAAGALSSERGARFLAGGTLVMRAVNEADPMIETIVRSTDPTFSHISASSGRVELGAGVTMAAILAERELAFLHPVARAVGGPAVREAATVGGNLFAPSPYGDFAAALLALDATVVFAGGFGQREVPLEEFLRSRWRRRSGSRKSPAFIPRASRCFRSLPSCRSPAAGSTARGSPITPWTKLRFVPKLRSALSKAARSTPPA
jgi:CO/xanthine dehydrogenase FAD-binding subunit